MANSPLRSTIWLTVLYLFAFFLFSSPVYAQQKSWVAWEGIYGGISMKVFIVGRSDTAISSSQSDAPWWTWGNTISDLYLFDFENDGTINLIIDFAEEQETVKATLYTLERIDRLDAILRQEVQPGQILDPLMVIKPTHGAWMTNGIVNFDLEIASWRSLPHDPEGRYEVETLVGTDIPGHPTWMTATLLDDPRPGDGYPRFNAAFWADNQIAYELADPLMPSWPYLSIGHGGLYETPELELRPIYFDLQSERIGGAWVGFHTAGIYEINSLSYPPDVDFESPFAFYRFDPEFGKYPNLVVRSQNWPALSRFGFVGSNDDYISFRMAWTADQPQRWRYALNVSGSHVITESTTIGPVEINALSYADLPEWVSSATWSAVTFVEASDGFSGSEGIYSYSVQNIPLIFAWLNGLVSEKPVIFDSPYLSYPTINPELLDTGFRGEYSLDYHRVPELYFSPLDMRVHLKHAEKGMWNIDGRLILRTGNLNSDAYVDHWSLETINTEVDGYPEAFRAVSANIEEQLFVLSEIVLFAGGDRIILVNSSPQNDYFDVAIPSDDENWRNHREILRPMESHVRDPKDLASWLEFMTGARMEISGASVSNVRHIDGGFRFEIELNDGFQVGGHELLDLANMPPGQYIVAFNGAGFTVEPLLPPALSLIVQLPPVSDGSAGLQVEVTNGGNGDATDLALVVDVFGEGDAGQETMRRSISVPGYGISRDTLSLADLPPDVTDVRARLLDANGNELAVSARLPLATPSASENSVPTLFRAPVLVSIILLFGAFIVMSILSGGEMFVDRRSR